MDTPVLANYQTFTCISSMRTEDAVLFGLVLWHINRCRLFNAKSIFM